MEKNRKIKIIAVVLTAVLFLNLTLFVLNKIKGIIFWPLLIVIALIAYKGIPYLKKND